MIQITNIIAPSIAIQMITKIDSLLPFLDKLFYSIHMYLKQADRYLSPTALELEVDRVDYA